MAVLAVVAVGAGCAALKQGLAEAENGIEPNLSVIEAGPGWSCYVANERTWSGCWRTAEVCNSERDSNKTAFNIDTLTFNKWGTCQPAVQAFCLTYEKMEMQANGSAKYVPTYECLPDDLSCSEFAASLKGQMRVSKCVAVK